MFTLAATALGVVVGAIGSLIGEPAARSAVWTGVGIALAVQLVLFVTLFVVAFASQPLLAYGIGMLGRFFAFGAVALIWVPWAGVPAAPLLFSLVAVFFLTTLLEPLYLLRHTTVR